MLFRSIPVAASVPVAGRFLTVIVPARAEAAKSANTTVTASPEFNWNNFTRPSLRLWDLPRRRYARTLRYCLSNR